MVYGWNLFEIREIYLQRFAYVMIKLYLWQLFVMF